MKGSGKVRRLIAVCFVAGLVWGCGNERNPTPASSGGSPHPEGWIGDHGDVVVAGNVGCVSCHGSAFDGGTAGVACDQCHGTGGILAGDPALAALKFGNSEGTPVIDHAQGWETDEVVDATIPFYTFTAPRHGYVAKQDPADDTVPVGFSFCSDCHTPAFTGTSLPYPPFRVPSENCLACHGNGTPHSDNLDEWASYHHITTSPENTEVCGGCHAGGNNSPLPPPTPVPSVDNRCFNGTLCHTGNIVTSPLVDHFDGHWDFHKQNPDACGICHGEDFKGRGQAPACFSCHNGQTAPQCVTCHDVSLITGAKTKAAPPLKKTAFRK